MSMVAIQPKVQWVSASPLWDEYAGAPTRMQQPALLRFASDTFMDDLNSVLQREPSDMADLIAQPESFRARPTGASAAWRPQISQLKLYQPAHGHFYLVAASLVCRLVGLPDRTVSVSGGEQVGFVLRRISEAGEMAWIDTAASGKQWQELARDENGEYAYLAPFEELLPMFPVTYTQDDRRRRLHVGFIPTSSRETFQAAPQSPISPLAPVERDPASGAILDPRMEEAETRVLSRLEAWRTAPPTTFNIMREGEREASLFLLLDLAEFLQFNVPATWQAIYAGNRPPVTSPGRGLYDLLAATPAAGTTTWRTALRQAWDQADRITEATPDAGQTTLTYNLHNSNLTAPFINSLRNRIEEALGAYTPSSQPAGAVDTAVPKLSGAGTLYVLRCVYKRPGCGPLEPPSDVVSRASRQFAIAPFFDFDAPARPVRITLPVDTSIAGLRKFDKNVAFMISDKLREQMSSITDLKKALDGNLASGQSFDLGVICSFSIPIITICAFVLLLIFVVVLNIVFWWMPFFRICLPIGLKAKG